MKKFPLLALFLLVLSACKLDPVRDVWEYYEDWRNENNASNRHPCRHSGH